MTERLPTVGSDSGTWGTVLDGFLGVAFNADGTLKADTVTTVASSGATYTFATAAGAYLITLTSVTVVFTMPTAVAGAGFTVAVKQDGTGNRVPTFTSVKWPGGPPVFSTAPGSKDRVFFYCDDVSFGWEGYLAGIGIA